MQALCKSIYTVDVDTLRQAYLFLIMHLNKIKTVFKKSMLKYSIFDLKIVKIRLAAGVLSPNPRFFFVRQSDKPILHYS